MCVAGRRPVPLSPRHGPDGGRQGGSSERDQRGGGADPCTPQHTQHVWHLSHHLPPPTAAQKSSEVRNYPPLCDCPLHTLQPVSLVWITCWSPPCSVATLSWCLSVCLPACLPACLSACLPAAVNHRVSQLSSVATVPVWCCYGEVHRPAV